MIGLQLEAADVRLAFWDQILRDEPVDIAEIDAELLPLMKSASSQERIAFIVLRSCVVAQQSMSPAMRRNLRAALIHWFSSLGTSEDTVSAETVDAIDIRSLLGRKLTWKESARMVGGNPEDYSAYGRLLKKLQTTAEDEWVRAFGKKAPFTEETS